jgi:hypothetical protein|tara:strand:+ start:27731 stop:27883 length:153 start_codon:yes stop_codon:yes gene_type:complete
LSVEQEVKDYVAEQTLAQMVLVGFSAESVVALVQRDRLLYDPELSPPWGG